MHEQPAVELSEARSSGGDQSCLCLSLGYGRIVSTSRYLLPQGVLRTGKDAAQIQSTKGHQRGHELHMTTHLHEHARA